MWHSGVTGFGYFKSRILWVKVKFARVNECVRVSYGPTEGHGGETERFWIDLDMVVDRIGNKCRFDVLEDLNRWVGGIMKDMLCYVPV